MSMTTSPPGQFGKRGVKVAALKSTGPDMWTAHAAAVALGSVTQFNRPDPTPSLKSLSPAERSPDDWTPTSRSAADVVAGDRPGFLALLFSPQGRIGRRDYWLILTGDLIGAVTLLVLLGLNLPIPVAVLAGLPVLAVYGWIRLCARIKRWHDRDKSATWGLVGVIPFVGWIWAMVECGFLAGTPGPNRYGPAPS